MDYHERSDRYLFWRRFIIGLTAIGLVYILFIRPLQIYIVRKLIVPTIKMAITPDSDIATRIGNDEFYLVSTSRTFSKVKIEVPFNGFFWLAMAMIWPTRNRHFSRVVWIYNWALFLIIPLIILGILAGWNWLVPLAKVHEDVYKALFLILGILALRSADKLLKG